MVATTLVRQNSISLKISTPLGPEAVILESLQGEESLSQPYEFTLRLVSENPQISFQALLGKAVTVSIDCNSETRYINGVVGQLTQLITAKRGDDNATYYEAKIYPTFWMLKLTQDCRIFQNKTPMEIIKEVLQEHTVLDLEDLTRICGHEQREYCVQYNESAFDFIHRLLEEEGIFYYFRHENNRHVLIFGDNPSVHKPYALYEVASMMQVRTSQYFLGQITSCFLKQHVVPKVTTLGDYNFTLAGTNLLSKTLGEGEGGEIYQYPAQFDHEDKPDKTRIEALSKLQLQRDEAGHEAIEGTSTIPFFVPGFWFHLRDHPRMDANRTYVLHTVSHQCQMSTIDLPEEGLLYQNTYQAFPATVPFRPLKKTPKPRIYSTQTARVTGPAGEEIWVDKYGRIKVLFHWDRLSGADQESSCWVRVAEGWAGNNWGILFTPRIGMEVVVTFIEGDPDRPLIIGSVYNSDNMPPYLPEQPTKSTIKSNSSKGGLGSNEIRFEDLKGSEQVYFHAQKDRDARVKQNVTDWIEGGSSWLWVDQGNREAILGGIQGVPKTTPLNQNLPAGKGDDNLTLLKGSKTTKLLGQGTGYNVIITQGDHFVQIDQGKKYIMGGQVDEFIQIEQGNFDKLLMNGDRSVVTYQGNSHDYIVNGHKTVGITTGSLSQEVINGNMLMGVDRGNLMEAVENGMIGRSLTQGLMNDWIDQGNYSFHIKQGNSDYKIDQGNESTELGSGNQTTKLLRGDQHTELSLGNRSIKLAQGNEDHDVNGNFTHHVSQDYTLRVGGNLTIIVQGQTNVKSTGAIRFSTPSNIDFSAGENINMSAGMSISQKAGMNITQSAGMTMQTKASLEMSFSAMTIHHSASVAYNVDSGVEASLKAGAMMTINAAMVMIA